MFVMERVAPTLPGTVGVKVTTTVQSAVLSELLLNSVQEGAADGIEIPGDAFSNVAVTPVVPAGSWKTTFCVKVLPTAVG